MEKYKEQLEELQQSLSTILYEVEKKRLPHHEAANRVVEVREKMDELSKQMKITNQPVRKNYAVRLQKSLVFICTLSLPRL